jgi:hypothetical protein
MLTKTMHFLNEWFNSIVLVFYMFRTSYVYRQENYIVHAALYGMFFMHLCKVSSRSSDVNISLRSALSWLTLHNSLYFNA